MAMSLAMSQGLRKHRWRHRHLLGWSRQRHSYLSQGRPQHIASDIAKVPGDIAGDVATNIPDIAGDIATGGSDVAGDMQSPSLGAPSKFSTPQGGGGVIPPYVRVQHSTPQGYVRAAACSPPPAPPPVVWNLELFKQTIFKCRIQVARGEGGGAEGGGGGGGGGGAGVLTSRNNSSSLRSPPAPPLWCGIWNYYIRFPFYNVRYMNSEHRQRHRHP